MNLSARGRSRDDRKTAGQPNALGAGATTTCARRSSPVGCAPGTELSGGRARRDRSASSRGPIREALGRLASEGLVTIAPRRGAVVRALSREEFIEAYQVREALETMAVRLAVPRSTRATSPRSQRADRRDDGPRRPRGDVQRLLRRQHGFHERLLRGRGQPDARTTSTASCVGQIDRHRLRSLELRGNLQPLDRRAQGDPRARPRQATSSARSTSCPSTSACRRSALLGRGPSRTPRDVSDAR